jgi:hypothetical protein
MSQMKNNKWWETKWWWVLCILLPLVSVPVVNLFFFPEVPLSGSIVGSLTASFGIFLAYLAYFGKLGRKHFDPRTLRRVIFIVFGAFTVGLLLWAFIILPLASYFFGIGGTAGIIVFLLLPISMLVWAFMVDTIMKRRDYRPFFEGEGNI